MPDPSPADLGRSLPGRRFAVVVSFDLHEGESGRFLELVLDNAAATLACEPGCIAFDVLRPSPGGAETVVLYEVYRDRRSFDQHLETGHFAAFDAATREMVRGKAVTAYVVEQAQPAGAARER